MRRKQNKIQFLAFAMVICLLLGGCGNQSATGNIAEDTSEHISEEGVNKTTGADDSITAELPDESTELEDTEPLQSLYVTESENMQQSEEDAQSSSETVNVSYLAEDGSVVRISPEALLKYEWNVMEKIMALPEEKPASSLQQSDLDEATVQWMNTTYAVMMYQNHFDYTLIGGEKPGKNSSNVRLLERDWGVTDRASAIENLNWLLLSGHRQVYDEETQALAQEGVMDFSLENFLLLFELSLKNQYPEIEASELEGIKPYFTTMYNAYHTCGEAGVDAWDYCRIMQMCGDYYVAGYLTLEECMDISLAVAELLRAEYVSWEDMMTSYLYGYDFWRMEDYEKQGTGSYWRHYFYNELYNLKDSPYKKYDWNMEFVVNWR